MRVVLRVVEGPHEGREFVFDEHDNFIVGRARFARFQLSTRDQYISRVHFLVEVNPPRCRLIDMGSTNGTLVNRRRVQSADLNDGDLIGVGKTVMRVALVDEDEPAPAETGNSEIAAAVVSVASTVAPSGALPPPQEVGEATRTFHPGRPCPLCGGASPDAGEPGSPPCRLCPACRALADELAQPIAGFRLIRELGRGGMGVVYLAVRESGGELLAIKTIQPAIAGSSVQIERFLREARILERLEHPHIVAFRVMDEANGLLYFAMDFVRGTDAANIQKAQGGPIAVARAVGWTCQMLDALAYAHGRGFVHRDIKPANLLIETRSDREVARLSDFGLARTYQASRMSGLTMSGDIGGTMGYMAPEQITHFREVKPPADQYAAAASLYRLLTGQPIHDLPRTQAQQILKILQDHPVPILERRPDLPPALASIIHRALAREPGDRFPDAAAFRASLEPFAR